MANIDETLAEAMEIKGAIGAAVVELASGMTLGAKSTGTIDMETVAAGATEVVRGQLATMKLMGDDDAVEDILVSTEARFHVMRTFDSAAADGLFFYVVTSKTGANLALVRKSVEALAARFEI